MAGTTLNVSTTLQCPHGGMVAITTLNQTVKADGVHAALATDQYVVTGCMWQIPVGTGTVPSPCVSVKWILTDMRVTVNGNATLSATSVGFCENAQKVPQGPVRITNQQKRVWSQ